MVKKPSGRGWRLCLDYRAGNALAVKQHYPLPLVQDTLDKVGTAKYFASLDCLKAFWQIPNSKETQPKTAINFPWGKFEMTSMPMGMQAASATFQRTMDVLLRDLDFCVGFIDDILIYSDTWEDHLLHVAIVLDRVGGAGFTFNPAKCEIGKSSTKFLGHLVGADGNRPDPGKLDSVRNAPFPETKKDMHHWVGLCGYYAPFIPDYALITQPLQEYIHSKPKKNAQGKWVHDPPSPQVRETFDKLLTVISSDLLLKRPDFSKPFILTTDAAVLIGGCGAVLSQLDEGGADRPVSHWSVRWIETTAHWAPVEHECYALRRSIERYYEYLSSNHFIVYTDSEPILWLMSLRRPRGRMAEWILELQALDFEVRHRKGTLNIDSNALSRLALEKLSMREQRRNIALNAQTPFQEMVIDKGQPVESGQGTLSAVNACDSPRDVINAFDKSGQVQWKGRLVGCVLTDGRRVLMFPAFMGGFIFPSTAKVGKKEPVRQAALRALTLMLAPASGVTTDILSAGLGGIHLCKGERVVYAVFSRCTATLFHSLAAAALKPRETREKEMSSNAKASWLDLECSAKHCVIQDDAIAVRQLLIAARRARDTHAQTQGHQALMAVFQPVQTAAVLSVAPQGPLRLADGRAVPQRLLSEPGEVYDALHHLADWLTARADTDEEFLFVDCEFDMVSKTISAYGLDLVQVAAGPYIFVFDTLSCDTVLSTAVVFRPHSGDDISQAVPSLRHWLERPSTRIVMQAMVNDAAILKQHYDILVENAFDICHADAIITGYDHGRNLLALAEAYLPSHHMQVKGTFKHERGLFKIRPLPARELAYAWQDVADGPAMFLAIMGRLTLPQIWMVEELTLQTVERCQHATQVLLCLHDGVDTLLVDGAFPSLPLVGPCDEKSKESGTFRAACRTAIRRMVADTFGQATFPEVYSKIDKPRAMANSLVFVVKLGSPLAAVRSFPQDEPPSHEPPSMLLEGPGITKAALHSLAVDGNRLLRRCSRWMLERSRSRAIRPAVPKVAAAELCHHPTTKGDDRNLTEEEQPEDDEQAYDALLAALEHHVNALLKDKKRDLKAPSALHAVEPVKVEIGYDPVGDKAEVDVMSFTQVLVLIHDKQGRCLLLKREPASLKAREDGSSAALPSLRSTEDLHGVYRAQHALQMLFGPVRAVVETAQLHSDLKLTGMVSVHGKSFDLLGVYSREVESLEALPLQHVFNHRRCTDTHSTLYPGFMVLPIQEALLKTNQAERMALSQLLVPAQPGAAAGVAGVRLMGPTVPPNAQQKDATEGITAPTKRTLAPGELPSGKDEVEDLSTSYPTGRAIPRVADPLSLMKAMIDETLLITHKEMSEAQTEDADCKVIKEWMTSGHPDKDALKKVTPEIRALANACLHLKFRVVDDVLYMLDMHAANASDGAPHLRTVMPKAMQDTFIRALHDSFAHPGVKRTMRVAAARAWFFGMKAVVKRVVGNCPTCLFNKETVHRGAQFIPDNGPCPWHSVQMDLVHLNKATSGKEKALVIYDRFTRGVECFATGEDCNTDDVLNILLFELVPRHGWPKIIYVDRGSNFISEKARAWFEKMGIELRPADAHMHTVVGGCERFNHSLREMARAIHFDHGFEWDVMLPLLVFWYNQLVQTATGFSPFYLDHGRDAFTPWDLKQGPQHFQPSTNSTVKTQFAALHMAWQCTRSDLEKKEEEQRRQHDKKYQTNVKLNKGDRVLIRQAGRKSKMHMPYVGPFKITEVLERDRYRVQGRRNAKKDHHEFHISRLKHWPEGADEEEIYLSEEYFDVDRIVGHREEKGRMLYRVRWQGYGALEDQWLPFEDMNGPCARAALDYIKELEDAKEEAREQQHSDAATASAPPAKAAAEPTQQPKANSPTPTTAASAKPTAQELRDQRLQARQERMGAADPTAKGGELKKLQ